MIVNMHEAETNLPIYVEKALAGEEVIFARADEPLVMLVPFATFQGTQRNNVVLGVMEGAFKVPEDFDDPV